MKYLFIFLFSTFAFFAGCNKEDGKEPAATNTKADYNYDTTSLKVGSVTNPNQIFDLTYKFEKGKEYVYRLTSITKETTQIKADSIINQNIDQTLSYIIKLVPIESDNDAIEMQCTVTNARVNAQTPQEKIYYETGITKDSTNLLRFADYEALVNNPFNFRVSKYGEVLEVFKADKIINKYLKINKADTISAEHKTEIKNRMIDANLKPLIGQFFRELPNKKLAKDSTWQKTQSPNQLMVFVMKNIEDFKVVNLGEYEGNKIAEVSLGFKTSFEGKNKISQNGVDYNFTTPVTNANGKLYFNVDKGCLQKANVKTSMLLTINAQGPGPRGIQRSTKTQKVENTNLLELLD
ncbi:MAG TPA: DUF6263 family protein [Ignavibacteriaceae bacterium]|nr:DUF6263 family protein [Ignavibacteriaceae bacterium]